MNDELSYLGHFGYEAYFNEQKTHSLTVYQQ